MRATFVAFSLTLLAVSFGSVSADAKFRCHSIRDSALCLAQPGCWYDAPNNKGCQDGPRPAEDACGVHGSESICASDTTLGCAWNADEKKCVTETN